MDSLTEALSIIDERTALRDATVARFDEELAAQEPPTPSTAEQARLGLLAFVHERVGLSKLVSQGTQSAKPHFDAAYIALRGLYASGGQRFLPEAMRVDALLSANDALVLHISVTGLCAERTAEVRHDLLDVDLPTVTGYAQWASAVTTTIAGAITRLIRKANGWRDVEDAADLVEALRAAQARYEAAFLGDAEQGRGDTLDAYDLVGLYNCAQMCIIGATYLYQGDPGRSHATTRIRRHFDHAVSAFSNRSSAGLLLFASLVRSAIEELIANSLWSHVEGLGESSQEYARSLVARTREFPILELWPGQQRAFQQNLLDPYRRAVAVQMPTSGGKTLLAKFAMLQAKSLNPTGTIAYIVPSRALVNQVTTDLRLDFQALQHALTVEQALPVVELDPTEDQLLSVPPDVLVTTPEKFDLLIRRNHPSVAKVMFVVADEAHNLADPTRGPRLELLLGTLKRERRNARYLLLSPFFPNAHEIASWLGGDERSSTIAIDWRPTPRVVAALQFRRTNGSDRLNLKTLRSINNVGIPAGRYIDLGVVENAAKTIENYSEQAVAKLRRHGSTLVLCAGPGTATSRAVAIAEMREERSLADVDLSLLRFLDAELGQNAPLSRCIRRGVAYHHAGLSAETKLLVERFIRLGIVDTVCGTTTLAEGVNFPIKSVILESTRQRRYGAPSVPLSYERFWNIAGRAGRALLDSFGVVAFPRTSRVQEEEIDRYLVGEAAAIASQLIAIVEAVQQFGATIGNDAIEKFPQLGALLQYLSHALKVSGDDAASVELDDILRGSLAYHQAERLGPEFRTQFLEFCRRYLAAISGRTGLMELSDITGFATPTVLSMISRRDADKAEFRNEKRWEADRLFGLDIAPLEKRVAAVANVPGLRLGWDDRGTFSPRRVAEIARDWVNGVRLPDLAQKYKGADGKEDLTGISRYVYGTLAAQLSWGLAAFESVCLAGIEPSADVTDARYVASYIYFGVRTREAVWMRMAGVPRLFADRFGSLWRTAEVGAPSSFADIRAWVRANRRA